jgi:hypothetical protein
VVVDRVELVDWVEQIVPDVVVDRVELVDWVDLVEQIVPVVVEYVDSVEPVDSNYSIVPDLLMKHNASLFTCSKV